MVLPVVIKDPLDVAVQCTHDADAPRTRRTVGREVEAAIE
jgi:hypothetical protein